MAKTPLFSRLRNLTARAMAAEAPGLRVERRALLGYGVGVALAGCGPSSSDPPPSKDGGRRIAIVGAGLAGLHCAFRLTQADSNLEISVYEANTRTGGRVFTGRNLFSDKALFCELGGEFIETEHATMLSLADELGIALEDRSTTLAGEDDSFWVRGVEVGADKLLAGLSSTGPAMLSALSGADDNEKNFRLLDNTTIFEFLANNVPETKYPELFRLLNVAFRAELGVETDVPSALNLWRLFPLDATRITNLTGNVEHRFRATAGNHLLVEGLARFVRRVITDRRLVSVRPASTGGYELRFESQTHAGYVETADHVVFALPFSTLKNVDLSALPLSEKKRTAISGLSYGTAVKLISAFSGKPWRDRFGKNGNASSDLAFQTTWDGTRDGNSTQSLLTNLFAGDAGTAASRVSVNDNVSATLDALDTIWGPVSGDYEAGSAVRMHWPSAQFARGSASVYVAGQFGALYKSEGGREGNLHFCGEHCSLDFKGSMEGAAETGALVAAEILTDFGIPLPDALKPLIQMKALLPQPAYRGSSSLRTGLAARRQLIAETHREFVAPLLSRLSRRG